MTLPSTDMNITELDKLIHSFEFENQQSVKAIEKESELMKALHAQIQEKNNQTEKLQGEVSGFDQDTKHLHRQYTNNRDNMSNLKSTRSVMSDHELVLSKQLEGLKTRTEEDSKYYKDHIFKYSSIRDDYMRKYRAFSMALDLQKEIYELATFQKMGDEVEAVKNNLEEEIGSKEAELGSKVMTQIAVKIVKTNLVITQLEKEIHDSLTEKTLLLEQLKEIQDCKQSEQVTGKCYDKDLKEQCSPSEFVQENKMDTDVLTTEIYSYGKDTRQAHKICEDNYLDAEKQFLCHINIDNETFAKMSIQDRCHLDADKQDQISNGLRDMKAVNTNSLLDEGAVCNAQDGDQEMVEDTVSAAKECFITDVQQKFERNAMILLPERPILNSEMECMTVLGSSGSQAERLQKDAETAKTTITNSTCSTPMRIKNVQAGCRLQKPVQHNSEQESSNSASFERDARKPPSLRMPAFSIPKPPRIPPLPVSKPSSLYPEMHQTSTLLMKQPGIRREMSISNPMFNNQEGLVVKEKSQGNKVSKESIDNPAKESQYQPCSDSKGVSKKENNYEPPAEITTKGRKMCESEETKNNHQSPFNLSSVHDACESYNKKRSCKPVCEDKDDTDPDSVFTLFSASQNSDLEVSDASMNLTFGKFIDGSGSPSSDEASSNLFNLFCKTQEPLGSPAFALSFEMEKDEEMETANSGSLFQLEEKNTDCSFFGFKNKGNGNPDENQGPKLFNIF